MSENVMELTDDNFGTIVEKVSGVALVDFWAEWCAPCRVFAPVLDEIAAQYAGSVTVAKLNVDQGRNTAEKCEIRAIPTIILFRDGKEVERFVGITKKETLIERLEAVISELG
jgi:thioredoxin 1